MYNLRYHIASLVAVFLALAVGLLLGTIVVDRGVLSSQRTTLVEGLQKNFNEIRSESAETKKANDALTSFASDATPRVVAGALLGKTVLVIAGSDTGDTVSQASSDVRAAGGTVAVATFSDSGLALKDPKVAAAAAKVLGASTTGSVEETAVVAALAHEWSSTGSRPLTKALVDAGGLKVTGLPAAATVGGVVVTAAFGGKPDAAALRLARALSDGTHPAVGVETTKRTDGTAKAAKAAGISGVDDIDTPMGQVSLVWVLAGRATGLFGSGNTVDGPYPSPLFPAS